ncbi:MAG: hypothetical protein EG825_09180 [Rhodocyclaceae bacterium]|nr:hypothetical protein [Rhodocyclaceae bacterium]
MLHTVTVSFDASDEYEFKFQDADIAGLSRDDARDWLFKEYEALECAPRNPVGKLLILDIILDVAKYAGAPRFAAGGEWATRFAHTTSAALGRDTVRVDVPNLTVG